MKIKKTIKKEETVEVDVTLPYFTKEGSGYYYCLLTESDCLSVHFLEFAASEPNVRIKHDASTLDAINGSPITQKEFEDAYEKAADYLHTKFESMRDTLRDRKAGVIVDELVNTIKNIGEGEE